MKPLSAIYFIKENKIRCFLMIFIFVLTYVIYIGGLYLNNIEQSFVYSIQRLDKFAVIQPNGTWVDEDNFQQSMLRCMEDDRLLVIEQVYGGSILVSSIMGGVKNGFPIFSFKSVEDFRSYCEYMNIDCDLEGLKDGSAIMSEMFALNRGIKKGDEVKAEEEQNEILYGDFTLDAITDEDGYSFYTIGGKEHSEYLILPVEIDLEQFEVFLTELENEYDVTATTGQYLEEEVARQMSSMNKIYFFIVIFTAVVMAVTINAVFVGLYQKREPEFAVYRAIGIGRKRIRRKIVCEILVMDLIGLLIGGIVCITALYLLNTLYFRPSGRYIFYYHHISLIGMLICNAVVLIPLIFTRSRQMIRTDICQF